MKNIKSIGSSWQRAALMAAAIGLGILMNSALAQEKGGERLAQRANKNTAVAAHKDPTAAKAMSCCPKCKDTTVSVAQAPGKGGRQELTSVKRHECPTCSTKIVQIGVGKQAREVVQHTCLEGSGQTAACCATKDAAPAHKH